MGKTKTAFVGGLDEEVKKPSYDKAAKEAKRQARAAGQVADSDKSPTRRESHKPADAKPEKVHIPGLKGGQRVKLIEANPLEQTTPSEIVVEGLAKPSTKIKVARVRGKKYKEVKSKIDVAKKYKLADAIKLVKATSIAKFDATFELTVIVKRKGINLNITLPYSFGKTKKIEVANDATLERLKTGKIDFDVLLSTPEMMPKLVLFAKLLGPRGLMPNPKNGTIIKSPKDAEKFSAASMTVKTEKDAPVIHTVAGKVSQKDEEIQKNIETILEALDKKSIVKVYLKSTMSPSIKLLV